ncbi:hypothetical protein [Methanobrevibacter sp.]|uniref:hypothetical protein n=1 Tax=Methanobrevibacter sp. TaxID=66852 RepID=UPI00388D92DD
MRIGPIENDVSEEKKELTDGRVVIRHYVRYDPSQDGYLDSTRFWGSHYIECIYNSNGGLISKTLKENKFGQQESKTRSKLRKGLE